MAGETPTRRTEAAPPLTDAYHRARRSYGFFGGVLIAWELVGIELNEIPSPNLNLLLKSPAAIPYVLLVLVLYFAFRTSVEWYQCSQLRRETAASLIDFRSAHAIGVFAVWLFCLQRALDLHVAESTTTTTFFAAGALAGFSFFYLLAEWSRLCKLRRRKGNKGNVLTLVKRELDIFVFSLLLFLFCVWFLTLGIGHLKYVEYLVFAAGFVLGLALCGLLRYRRKPADKRSGEPDQSQ